VKKFTLAEALRYGWDTALKNIGFLIAVVIVGWVIPNIPSALSTAVAKYSTLLSVIFTLLGMLISFIIQIGMIKIALKIYDNQIPDFGDLFNHTRLFFKFLIGSMVYFAMVFGGMILLIVPGIILAIKYQFMVYFIVDQEMSPMEALRRSGEITEGIKWDLFALDLALMGINMMAAVFTCGLGILVTAPMTMMAMAYVYRRLTGPAQPEQMVSVPPAIG